MFVCKRGGLYNAWRERFVRIPIHLSGNCWAGVGPGLEERDLEAAIFMGAQLCCQVDLSQLTQLKRRVTNDRRAERKIMS